MKENLKNLWSHPILPIFQPEVTSAHSEKSQRLYLIPTLDLLQGESWDPDSPPQPTHPSQLPEAESWVRRYAIGIVEIWSAKRPAMQLARWSHRKVFKQLISPSPISEGARIRKIYLNQPIEGVIEATITLLMKERVRSLALRFEGVDKRWLCTELILI